MLIAYRSQIGHLYTLSKVVSKKRFYPDVPDRFKACLALISRGFCFSN